MGEGDRCREVLRGFEYGEAFGECDVDGIIGVGAKVRRSGGIGRRVGA